MKARLGCALIVTLLAGAPGGAASLAEIQHNGVLHACLAPIEPALVRRVPTGCTEGCSFAGLVVEQVEAFVDTLEGVELALREVEWSDQFRNADGHVNREESYSPALLADGSCDVFVSNLALLPWRERKMIIVPLFESRMIVMVDKDRAAEFHDIRALAGKVASVQEESSFHSWLLDRNAALPAAERIEVQLADLDEPFDLVAAGLADFTLTDADIAVLAMNRRGGEVVPAFSVGEIQQLGWGVRRDSEDLARRIAAFFETQRQTANSRLNLAWRAHLGVSILEFEALVRSLPSAPGEPPAPKND